jgi:light-regulated signal transduction histidine kinase (bacteriophytochrome)
MYFTQPREPSPNDLALAEVVTQTAAVIISAFTNVRDRRIAEDALRTSDERYRVQLEQEVLDRTRELKKNREELFEKNSQLNYTISQLESFNYLASHDLREPLRKIQTYVSLVNKNKDDKNLSSYLKSIDEASKRMTQLIEDLLGFSRLASSDQAFQQVDLNKTLNNVKSDYELRIKEKQARIVSDELPTIHAIPFQMHQLFANLLSNSLKFNENKPEIKISARIISGSEIEDMTEADAKRRYAEIKFVDNGIGFDNQFNKKIFELFQRLHSRSEYSGTGIGLGIVDKIVKNHNGFVKANGEEKQGATFTVYLPVEA